MNPLRPMHMLPAVVGLILICLGSMQAKRLDQTGPNARLSR